MIFRLYQVDKANTHTRWQDTASRKPLRELKGVVALFNNFFSNATTMVSVGEWLFWGFRMRQNPALLCQLPAPPSASRLSTQPRISSKGPGTLAGPHLLHAFWERCEILLVRNQRTNFGASNICFSLKTNFKGLNLNFSMSEKNKEATHLDGINN